MRKSVLLFSALALVIAFAGIANATGAVRGDSIILFNSGSTGSAVAGFWATLANDGGAVPVHNATSWALYNDGSLTPTPNNPMVGDVNGDGVTDIVLNGKDINVNTINLGWNLGTTNIGGGVLQGDLFQPSVGPTGWQPAPAGNWSPFWNPNPDPDWYDYFIADVDGDGKDDAVSVRPTPWDGGATKFWVAQHSDAEGLEGHAPVISFAAGVLQPVATHTPLMGDFNGDGAADIANQDNATALIISQVSTPGTGLNAANPTMWGNLGFATNHLATLVGDIDGDGIDDIVQVDDRNSNGNWTWVAGLTGVNGGIPAGFEIAQGGPNSWVSPFSLHANSISATPLLADMDNDGRDDLVLFEEYLDVGGTGTVWGRLLTALTDDPAGGLFTNGFDFGSWYDYTAMFGVDASGMIPMVGNIHIVPEPGSIALLSLGGLLLLGGRRRRVR